MNEYKTIKDCAVDIICKEGDRLTHKQIAKKVREIMVGAKTTWKCIAFYKTKIRQGEIKAHQPCKGITEGNNKEKTVIIVEDQEDIIIQNEAERYVSVIEKERIGKPPKASPQNSDCGYDIDSGDRHIEVKSSKKVNKAWLNLTPNESEKLIKDPKYWLYLVEGDFEKDLAGIKVYMIPKDELLEMSQLKITVRLTRLSNQTRRKDWLYKPIS